ncbi:MAG TPA: helix-turn-helix domain-containing protein [Solirubrobacterales bacterium]
MGSVSKQSPNDTSLKRAVGHPKRLEMLGYLAAGRKKGMEEDELADALGLTPPLVKYHLGVLQSADLVAHVEESARGAVDRYIVAVPL